jgi:hypothetical protein
MATARGSAVALVEVEPPRRLARWVDRFTESDLKRITQRLKAAAWLTNPDEHCESRSQAYYRADALIRALSPYGLQPWQLTRRTWPEAEGHRWAIKLVKEEGRSR